MTESCFHQGWEQDYGRNRNCKRWETEYYSTIVMIDCKCPIMYVNSDKKSK